MQGQKGAIGSLPESLALEHGSASSDSGLVEQQICWNNYNHESQNLSMWSMGESSSSTLPNSVSQNRIDPKTADNGWSSLMKVCPESHHHEPPASMLSLGDVNMNITHSHANNGHHHGPLFVQNSHLESVSHNVTLNPPNFIPLKSSNHAGSSSSNPFEIEGQGRHLPCKRKAVELIPGQSSSAVGSSNLFQIPAENPPPAIDLQSDRIIPRLGLGVGVVSDDNRTVENNRRNVRIRINTSRQQEPQSNLAGPNPSLRLNSVDLRSPPVPPPTTEISSSQPVLRIPALRRNMHGSSRWSRGSCPRANRSSNVPNPVDNSRTIPTNISDHPIFVQPQTTINWNLNGVAATGNGGAATSNPVPPPSSTVPNLAPHRGSPHYPSRRLSEILRRSLLSSIDSGAGGGPANSLFSRLPPPVGSTSSSSQEALIPPVVGIPGHHHQRHHHHHHLPHSRSSDRLLDGAFGFPYLPRTVSAGSEGRGRLVSEIRNVLDLIRRGEGLRFEDVMILDQSVFYGMADIHDRHRDMRLDIDNMSYEELLALEERIGNVNTGLTEENISGCLKQKKYETVSGQPDAEPCCICQEEYKNGDDLGGLGCGHDFHSGCIKQWLVQKNMCPVCKSAASK